MFRIHNLTALYMEHHELFPEELRKEYGDGPVHYGYVDREEREPGGVTKNHHLMDACAAILVEQEWPELAEWKYEICREWLLEQFKKRTDRGYWEYHSPTYFIHHTGPLLSLVEHIEPGGSERADEPRGIKSRGRMMLEWMFAGLAGQWNQGFWMTSNGRNYSPVWTGPAGAAEQESFTVFWMYFGDLGRPPFRQPLDKSYLPTIQFAVADYDLPQIMKRIATDRDGAYVHREHFDRKPNAFKTSDIHPDYGVFSQKDSTEEGNRFNQVHRWSVTWVVGEHGKEPSTFFMKHPDSGYADAPHEEEYERGATGSGQVLQHEGTLVAAEEHCD